MKKIWVFNILIMLVLSLSACGSTVPQSSTTPPGTIDPEVTPGEQPVATNMPNPVSAEKPCIGAAAPDQWGHIVVIVFENKDYDEVIGVAPYITSLVKKCATAINWKDADFKVDGSKDGSYYSKPSYATLTNGLSPSEHGLVNDDYDTTTDVDNIYNQLNLAGKSFKDYYDGKAGGCDVSFHGAYHDAIRYYTNMASLCDAHDVPLSTFMEDVNNGNLPNFSLILPSNKKNMHDNSIANGDAYAQQFLEPLFNSDAYAKGDLAIFFMWDEGYPVPNVLIAPSILPGSTYEAPGENPISHFSALRTWEEMLGLPMLGDTDQAPSLLPLFNGQIFASK